MLIKAKVIFFIFASLQLTSLQTVSAQEPLESARQALEAFLVDWNRADNSAITEHLSFPHITHVPGRLVIANSAEEFNQDFDALRRQGWRRSSFDKFLALPESANKVNFLVDFRRYDADDEVMSAAKVFYVVTLQDGEWGMQYRSGGPGPEQFDDQRLSSIEQQARAAIDGFFRAFNNADADELLASNHIPQVMLNGSNFILAERLDSPLVRPNFTGLRRGEDWQHSAAKNINAIHVVPDKVVFEMQFERFNSAGQSYQKVSAL